MKWCGNSVRRYANLTSSFVERDRLARLGDAVHKSNDLRDFAAERARVHHQSAADSAGNAFAEFEPLKTPIDNCLDQGTERCASACDDFGVINFYLSEPVAESHHQPAHPAIAHEQIRPSAEAEARHARAIRGGLRMHQFGFVLDVDKQIRRSADSKRRQLRQGHRRAYSCAEFRAELALKRLHEL